MAIGALLLISAGATAASATAEEKQGRAQRRGLRRQANEVLRNARTEIEANIEEARLRAATQRTQFATAGVETTAGGTVQAVQETDLLATLEENERIYRQYRRQAGRGTPKRSEQRNNTSRLMS